MGLYENIKSIAKSRNISINKIEKDLSLPRSSLVKYNTNIPSIDKVAKVAQYLEVSIDLIYYGENIETVPTTKGIPKRLLTYAEKLCKLPPESLDAILEQIEFQQYKVAKEKETALGA